MQTIRLPYITSVENKTTILEYQKQYSLCLRFMFNRIKKDNLSETEIKHLNINNTNLLDSWFKQSCVKEASQINNTNKDNKVYFGGKKNFFKRLSNKISKEEYQNNKLSSLYSIGEGSNPSVKSNRKFHIEEELNKITFKPKRGINIELKLPKLKQNYLKLFRELYFLQENKQISITYKINQDYIYIIYDENDLVKDKVLNRTINNRILSFDLNPNYIGWSVVDWKDENEFNVINSGVYSIKLLNDKEKDFKELKLNSSDKKHIKLNNKRKFETLQLTKILVKKAIHYRVELVSFENLNIKSKDNERGKAFNKLVNNNWLRNIFVDNIKKRLNLHKIKCIEVKPEYSSFIGNILYRDLKLPDMVLSSIELSRRGYEFNLQYLKKIKEKNKNIIIPKFDNLEELMLKSLEEFNINDKFDDLIKLYYFLKNLKIKYRVSIDELDYQLFSSQKHNSLVKSLTNFH